VCGVSPKWGRRVSASRTLSASRGLQLILLGSRFEKCMRREVGPRSSNWVGNQKWIQSHSLVRANNELKAKQVLHDLVFIFLKSLLGLASIEKDNIMTLIALDKLLGWAVRYVHNLLVSHYVPNITILFVPYPLPEIALPLPPTIYYMGQKICILSFNIIFCFGESPNFQDFVWWACTTD